MRLLSTIHEAFRQANIPVLPYKGPVLSLQPAFLCLTPNTAHTTALYPAFPCGLVNREIARGAAFVCSQGVGLTDRVSAELRFPMC